MTGVVWVTARKKALARCLAVDRATQEGLDWYALTIHERRRRERDAHETVSAWTAGGVLAEFAHEWRGRV